MRESFTIAWAKWIGTSMTGGIIYILSRPEDGKFVITFIVAIFALGLGLIFATLNVFFRDAENFVDLILMVSTWASPVLYPFTMVQDKLPQWVYYLYFANPLTVAVELFHYGFWFATTELPQPRWHAADHLLSFWTPFALLIALATLFVGDLIFRRQEGNFAQEL